MPVPVWKPDVPRAILLATDLASRCDRALDRALQLAMHWSARLVVLTVIETENEAGAGREDPSGLADASDDSTDPRLLASTEVRRAMLAAASNVTFEVLVRERSPGDRQIGTHIEAVAADSGCSLIVTGTARSGPFGRILLGSTVLWLSKTSPLPVLIVRRRTNGEYSRIVIASDFSPSSRHALETISAMFPEVAPTLFHAFDVPFLGMIDTQRDATVGNAGDAALLTAREFLADAGRPTLPIRVEHGDPAVRLRDHARRDDTDLIVVASHGRSALFNLLIGSIAQQILELSPCDTLLVPEPKARKARKSG